MYLQGCGFGEMFATISSMSLLVRPLSSVSFHVHLQVVSTRKCFSALFTWPWTFLLCGKAYVSSRLWFWCNVCHNFFNVCIGKAFMCIFKLCPLENSLAHISHLESLSPVSSGHVDLQTLPTWENFCTTSAFVSTFSRNKAYTQRELSCASSSCFH